MGVKPYDNLLGKHIVLWLSLHRIRYDELRLWQNWWGRKKERALCGLVGKVTWSIWWYERSGTTHYSQQYCLLHWSKQEKEVIPLKKKNTFKLKSIPPPPSPSIDVIYPILLKWLKTSCYLYCASPHNTIAAYVDASHKGASCYNVGVNRNL